MFIEFDPKFSIKFLTLDTFNLCVQFRFTTFTINDIKAFCSIVSLYKCFLYICIVKHDICLQNEMRLQNYSSFVIYCITIFEVVNAWNHECSWELGHYDSILSQKISFRLSVLWANPMSWVWVPVAHFLSYIFFFHYFYAPFPSHLFFFLSTIFLMDQQLRLC